MSEELKNLYAFLGEIDYQLEYYRAVSSDLSEKRNNTLLKIQKILNSSQETSDE